MATPKSARVALLGVAAAFLAYQWWLRPANRFGQYHDDTIYLASAKALSDGRGYVLPSLPGEALPPKYPAAYPWLLSWIYKTNPIFSAAVEAAVWVTALFGCWFLIAAFELLRSLGGIGPWPAMLLAAACAFQSRFLFLSGSVLSDIPFAALVLTAAAAADRAGTKRTQFALLAGVLAGLSIWMRGFGWAVLAGIVAAGLYRKRVRETALMALAAAPFAAQAVWPAAAEVAGPPGWRQTLLFYTDYGQFWKLSVPRLEVFTAMVSFNLQAFLEAPSSHVLFPPLGGGRSFAGLLLAITLTAGIFSGIVRQARTHGWKPIHFIFVFYTPMALVWNYALMDRFLIPFLPVFYAGLWVEGRHLAAGIGTSFRRARQRAAAGLLAAGLLVLGGLTVRHYFNGFPGGDQRQGERRAALCREKQEAYEWIRRNTAPATTFLAWEDVILHMETGRLAIRPINFSTEAFYMHDEKVLERDLAWMPQVAQRAGARYWLVAEDDFQLETGLPLIEKRMREMQSRLPVVFHSSGGRVRLYDLSSLGTET